MRNKEEGCIGLFFVAMLFVAVLTQAFHGNFIPILIIAGIIFAIYIYNKVSELKQNKIKEINTVLRVEEKKTPKYKIFIAAFLLISIIASFLRESKNDEISDVSVAPTVIESPLVIDTIATMIKEEEWEEHRFKNFSFQLPSNMKLQENLSNDTEKIFLDDKKNIGITINFGNLSSSQENSTIQSLVGDLDEFGLNINRDNKLNFKDFELESTQFDKLGNSESILVNQTSTLVSGVKNIKMKIMAQFVVTQALFYSFTFSYPENSQTAQETVLKIMDSFINDEVIESEQNKSLDNSSISQNLVRYRINKNHAYFYSRPDSNFRTNAYLILGESIESSLVENGYAYVEYKNQQGKSTIGWILLSDLQ